MNVYSDILSLKASGRKALALLVDPDKCSEQHLGQLVSQFDNSRPDLIFVGGSLVFGNTNATIQHLKHLTDIPVVLFPGNGSQLAPDADAMLLLSLISGRNAEYLIGQHVNAAVQIAASRVEVIPTGYILVESGTMTSVEYVSNTKPLPRTKNDIAVATALAGQQLGLRALYLEAGSGASSHIPVEMIRAVRSVVDIPLIVGGGLRSASDVAEVCKAGADIVVVGTAIEKTPGLLSEMTSALN